MRERLLGSLVAVVAVASLALTASAVAGPDGSDNGTMCVQNTQLRPENEVRPAVTTDPVESTAKGHAQIKVRNDGTIEYKIFILNKAGETFMAGHIHEAPVGENGPVRVTLFGGSTSERHIRLRGELPASQTTSANFAPSDVCTNPSGHYVNFHTSADPQGAIRGQLG
jgi:CHRD domain